MVSHVNSSCWLSGVLRVLGTRAGDGWPKWGLYQGGGSCGGCVLPVSWTEGMFHDGQIHG